MDRDGLMYLVRPSEWQIKSRGHRNEHGEIEVAANSLDAFREVAVVAVDSGNFRAKAICSWSASGDTPEGDRLRAELRPPAYALPARWLRLESLPKNANSKIERRSVREHFEHAEVASAPRARPV